MPGKKCRKKLFGACAVSVLLGCGRGPSSVRGPVHGTSRLV